MEQSFFTFFQPYVQRSQPIRKTNYKLAVRTMLTCDPGLRSGSVFVSLGETFSREGRNEKPILASDQRKRIGERC